MVYSAPCQFFDDPTAPLARVRWYFTDLPFETHDSVINSRHWMAEDARINTVGEQWIWTPKPRVHLSPVGLTGGHECGPLDWFENGQPVSPPIPPVVYDEDHIPTCCPRYYGLTVAGKPDSVVTTGPDIPGPGPDCPDATPIDLGTIYTGTLPGFTLVQQWWVFGPVTFLEIFNIDLTWTGPLGADIQVLAGSCAFNTVSYAGLLGNFTISFGASSNGNLYVTFVSNTLTAGGTYTFKLYT